ncbi:MAG: MBL fold metallo-hydrolase [Deltaproteobacteria bacterium]|nr:MBL fold metallo-hydrolase [Deltaproteobacteria bacterium]
MLIVAWLGSGCHTASPLLGRDAGARFDRRTDVDLSPNDGDAPCLPTPPQQPLRPLSGELYYEQIGLGGIALGEAAVAVGPNGDALLVDTGNTSHAATVSRRWIALTAAMAPNAPNHHVLLTHYHADHVDALAKIIDGIGARPRLIWRGAVDLSAVKAGTFETMCAAAKRLPHASLCLARAAALDCSATVRSQSCPGLGWGNLDVEGDSGPSYLSLGKARLDIIAVNGTIGSHRFEVDVSPFGTELNDENGRSLVALLRLGDFRLLISGDLTGGGKGTPNVETFLLSHLPSDVVGAVGVDVLHLGHHARETSNNQQWVERMLPADGYSRNAIVGASTGHIGSPYASVLDRVSTAGATPRLGEGRIWTTTVAPLGATHRDLVDARLGSIRIRTTLGGRAYFIQAIGADERVLASETYASVASKLANCPRPSSQRPARCNVSDCQAP